MAHFEIAQHNGECLINEFLRRLLRANPPLRDENYRLLCRAKPKLQTQPNSLFDIVQKCSCRTKRPISPPSHLIECKLHLLRIYNHCELIANG
ncbi:hypothetical protein NPIL_416461 [Nephila pilipes]|uniref:Uncharacterized protein n=1 Tax=Nephila pilipes TaxID=299642 RepID=A0A8X6R2F8_NEPPI|nr:hypothetical protein NPIL_416461 [Nephila pilipes]